MPDKCQWYRPELRTEGIAAEGCDNAAYREVTIQLTFGMYGRIALCRRHNAEYNRIQASTRIGRRK